MRLDLRPETEADFRAVEETTREAFWNLHAPGCLEHYLVHVLRDHADFLPDLSFVAAHGAEIVGSIFYSRSRVETTPTVTFGPLSVLPVYQRRGVGTALVEHTTALCREKGLRAVLIYGDPRLLCALRLPRRARISHLHRRRHVCRRFAGLGTVPRARCPA